jgi:hypothetical protein
MSDFITNFIEHRSLNRYRYTKNDTLNFLKILKQTNTYIGGEYIITILNNIKNKVLMTLYIHYSNFVDFIILNIDDILDTELYFDNIYTNTFLYIKIVTKKSFIYYIYIVPDDIEIVEYIKDKSISTLSEIWFYDNKIEGTNVLLSMEKKGYLKNKYVNLLINNLDEIIIRKLKNYSKNNFEIIINTEKYNKVEKIEYINKEKICILTFFICFYKNNDLLEYFYNNIIKKKYSTLDAFNDNKILLNKVNYILEILNINTYNLDSLKSLFNKLRRNNYSYLIEIIEELVDDVKNLDLDVFVPKPHVVKVLKDLIEIIK